MSQTVLITGGAGGLGRELARLYLARGSTVALLDREAAFEALDADLRAAPGIIEAACDLADEEATKRVCSELLARLGGLDVVIHSAGVTQLSPLTETPTGIIRKVMEINFFAAVTIARATLLALRASKGTHVALSSVAGFAPLIRRTGYAASKHALEGFFSSLRAEEADFGVSVTIVAPSFVGTNLQKSGPAPEAGLDRPGSAADGTDYIAPDVAARAILKAIDKKTRFAPIGRLAWLSWIVHRLSPGLYEKLMRRRIGKG